MSNISDRLRTAVDYLKRNGLAKSDAEVARKIGYTRSCLCECKKGTRVPSWELVLSFCDHYPINFWWLRSGDGDMIREDKTAALLRRISELENEIKELKSSLK